MKRRFFVLFIVSILMLTACGGNNSSSIERLPQPKFPLERETIVKTVEELGFPWVISDDESQESIFQQNAVLSNYILRDQERKYREDSEETLLHCGIISGIVGGHRYMSTLFDSRTHVVWDKPFSWEDWEQEINFCSILYGGFTDENEVYRELSKLEIPDSDSALKWGVQLSDGYCAVQRGSVRTSPSSGYALWINFYETEELYLKAERDKKIAFERAQEETKRRREAHLKRKQEEAESGAVSTD